MWKREVSKHRKTRQACCAEKAARGWIGLREGGDSRGAWLPLFPQELFLLRLETSLPGRWLPLPAFLGMMVPVTSCCPT